MIYSPIISNKIGIKRGMFYKFISKEKCLELDFKDNDLKI